MTMQVQFGFTPAECKVLALRFLGHTPESISQILNIERGTVDSHINQCLAKCQQHIGEDTQQPSREEHREVPGQGSAKSNINRPQRKYAPVIFAPVPEFAAFYL